MFKRVEKRRLKKEEENKLGLDEDMKEILGMHETDSEESASDSDDSDDVEEDGSGDDEENEQFDAEDESGAEESEEDAADAEDPDITVSQALDDPIYVVSVLPEVKACTICPGKFLKAVKMVQLHRISNAHERRFKQFKALAANADPGESAWEVLRRGAEEKSKLSLAPSEGATSKRAEKKKAHAAKMKLRREKAKARRAKDALEKKSAASVSNLKTIPGGLVSKTDSAPSSKKDKTATKLATSSLPKKKRKVEIIMGNDAQPELTYQDASPHPKKAKKPKHEVEGKGVPAVLSNSPSSKSVDTIEAKEAVKDVARSISDRAKKARQRAVSNLKGSKAKLKKTPEES